MNDMPREDENKNIGITEQLFTQYLVQWREHLDKVKYFPNLDVTTNCQAFQDLVNL
jgi:hypothetical protein